VRVACRAAFGSTDRLTKRLVLEALGHHVTVEPLDVAA
jgi:hypothetical protein